MIKSHNERRFEAVAYVVMTIVSLIIVFPFLLVFMSSITEESSLLIHGYSIFPKDINLGAYSYIWQSRATIFTAYGVTICITAIGTLLNVLITALVSYPLSLRNLPGRKLLTFIFLFTMLFNGGLVATYMIYTTVLQIKNTYMALLFPNLMFSAFNAIIVRSFLQHNIPVELYESAHIDGASEFIIFWRIVMPLGKPIFVTIGIFAGLGYWNDWMNGMYYISDTSKYSIQQLLNVMVKNIQYLTQYGRSNNGASAIPSISLRMAIAFVAMLPVLAIYPFLQKFFEKGITLGAVKG